MAKDTPLDNNKLYVSSVNPTNSLQKDSTVDSSKESLMFLMKDLFPHLNMTTEEKIDFVKKNRFSGPEWVKVEYEREFLDDKGTLCLVFYTEEGKPDGKIYKDKQVINCNNDLAKMTLGTRITVAKSSNDSSLLEYILLNSKEYDVIDGVLLNSEASTGAKLLAAEKASLKGKKQYILETPVLDRAVILKIMNVKGTIEYDVIRQKRLREYIQEKYGDNVPEMIQKAFEVEKTTEYESGIKRGEPLTDQERSKLNGF